MNLPIGDSTTGRRLRILFFAEAVTLAHVARPLVLAGAAARSGHDVSIACHERYRHFVEGAGLPWLPLHSISSRQFAQALANGNPVYDLPTLRGYLRDDLQLMQRMEPDLVVGDFRLSLSVGARLARVPYATVTNAYWSPFIAQRGFPMPVLPLSRRLPLGLARTLFNTFGPAVMALHCAPLNRLRRENLLPSLGSDLRRVYTDADHTLYADVPEMFALTELPPTHRHLGPILWSPPVPLPPWWDHLPKDRPIVYATLGSSGDPALLPAILAVLAGLPLTVIASSAGTPISTQAHASNVHVADYLPGRLAAARARLVICNGGSPTAQQALDARVPVLGIVSNMDQFLNMDAIVRREAGVLLRADRIDPAALRKAVVGLIDDAQVQEKAQQLSTAFALHNAEANFNRFLCDLEPGAR